MPKSKRREFDVIFKLITKLTLWQRPGLGTVLVENKIKYI